jgi:hypothetical protein
MTISALTGKGNEEVIDMGYESPINIIYGEINNKLENEVLTAIHNLGIDVNKEELVRALRYDREQYQKGYEDRDKEIVRCKDCKHWSNERINDYNKCIRWINVGVKNFATMGDWYCADGKREAEEK